MNLKNEKELFDEVKYLVNVMFEEYYSHMEFDFFVETYNYEITEIGINSKNKDECKTFIVNYFDFNDDDSYLSLYVCFVKLIHLLENNSTFNKEMKSIISHIIFSDYELQLNNFIESNGYVIDAEIDYDLENDLERQKFIKEFQPCHVYIDILDLNSLFLMINQKDPV